MSQGVDVTEHVRSCLPTPLPPSACQTCFPAAGVGSSKQKSNPNGASPVHLDRDAPGRPARLAGVDSSTLCRSMVRGAVAKLGRGPATAAAWPAAAATWSAVAALTLRGTRINRAPQHDRGEPALLAQTVLIKAE